MVDMLRVEGDKGFIDTSWDDADFLDTILGRAFLMDIGDEADDRRPVVAVVEYAPGADVPPHYHDTDYVSIVVDGEIEVTRRMHRRGSVRLVKKGTAYGPLKAGPEGCRVVEVFADRTGLRATFLGDGVSADEYRALQRDVLGEGVS